MLRWSRWSTGRHGRARSPAALVPRGTGIGFLPESARYLVERAGVALDRISVATAHIRYLDRRGVVSDEERHAYRFSSWNTVYRELAGRFEASRDTIERATRQIVQAGGVIPAFLFAGAVGVFFGLYPARKASRLNPIDALRYE